MTDIGVQTGLQPGQARSSGPTVQSLLSADSHDVPPPLLEESYEFLGSADIAKERYFDQHFHDLEVEKMWKKVWQMACREEDIADPGDYIVYDVADTSLIVLRTKSGGINAYHNACLHRGTQLRDADGHVNELRCPFHGFAWSLDGALVDVPCRWDFPHIDDREFALPQALTETWAGFVFVNLDLTAPPLRKYLGGIDEHFAHFDVENRFKAIHLAKIVDCNWKVGLEAFLESYHVIATHPQLLEYLGDSNTQYDIYPRDDGLPGFNRMMTPQATSSPHLSEPLEPQDVLEAMLGDFYPEGVGALRVPEGQSARPTVAEGLRQKLSLATGADYSAASDTEMLDAIQYFVFPNLVPWAGVGAPLTYRFRPYKSNPNQCIFDIMMLVPLPAGVPKPKASPTRWLSADDDFSAAPELGALCGVFNQDLSNLPRIQRGLRAMTKPGVTLGNYQEIRIRQFHCDLDMYLTR